MRKKIKVVNVQKLECSGTVTFTAKYEGRSTMVSALVLSLIQDKVFLSWKALVDLGVIPDSFPNVEARAAGAKASNQMTLKALLANVKTMIGTFDDIFEEEGKLRTMKGKPIVIEMKDDVPIKPVHVCSPRRRAYAFQAAAKENLEEDERKGMIEKVTGATILEDWYLEHIKPVSIRSDKGPQFRGGFSDGAKRKNIVHEKSSAHLHESNGHAESAIKDMKHLLGKTKTYVDL